MTATLTDHKALGRELIRFARRARTPRIRPIRQFAETEIVIPDGPYRGQRFRCHRQPYTGLFFDQVHNPHWRTIVATGPTQSGKTLTAFVIIMLYHLCEIGETVICGLPDLQMAREKWTMDILPVIEQSRFRDLLPRSGAGSRGGTTLEMVRLRNGAVLKFMSGGGDDKVRAHFTARVAIITETDGMDESGESSRETDKISQIVKRTAAFEHRARIYEECTVSLPQGRTWSDYTGGTESRIMLPCPHCDAYVAPEREHLVGWQNAADELEAAENGHFACPECGQPWSDDDRIAANAEDRVLLVHRGQEVVRGDDGAATVVGDPPRTRTLGFRWSAVNNLFWSPGALAAELWRLDRKADEEGAEKEVCQFIFATPYESADVDVTPLNRDAIVRRQSDELPRGRIPPWTMAVTVFIDLGKHLGHWCALAAASDFTCHVIDYGAFDIPSDRLGVERGTLQSLREFRELLSAGWMGDGGARAADQVWVDSNWSESQQAVYAFCREVDPNLYRPTRGYGYTQMARRQYTRPEKLNDRVRHIGDGYHFAAQRRDRVMLVHINADAWKSFVHGRLTTTPSAPGALSLFAAMPNEHRSFAHHLTAEKQREEFVPGRGTVVVWETVRRQNHWFDCLSGACAAAHFCGARLIGERPVARATTRTRLIGSRVRRDG